MSLDELLNELTARVRDGYGDWFGLIAEIRRLVCVLEVELAEARKERDENEGVIAVWRRRCVAAEAENARLRAAARSAMSACGNPDAAEGCRIVLRLLGAALNGGSDA